MKKNVYFLQNGFTLIELLASTVVIVSVSAIIIGILSSTLRGANKTTTINVTRQNGTYTISQVSKMLRFARTIDAIDGVSPSNCITNVPLPTPQPSLTQHTSVQFTTIDGGQTTLACIPLSGGLNPPYTIASNGASLLDTTAVQIPSGMCAITCDQSTQSDAMIIGVTFSLKTLQAFGPFTLPEFIASSSAIEYKTSVILRNVGR
jgi:prepilin-type N-terminal cleavage/methylation domain-containing protein